MSEQVQLCSSMKERQYLKTRRGGHEHEFTQRLQFRCRDNSYRTVVDQTINNQPSNRRGILNNEFSKWTTNANDYKVRRVYCDATTSSIANKQERLKSGQLEWIMLCSDASDISTSTSESLFTSGSLSVPT